MRRRVIKVDRDPKLFLSSGVYEHLHGTCILIQNPTTLQPLPVTSSLLLTPSTLSASCLLIFLIVLVSNLWFLTRVKALKPFTLLDSRPFPSRSSSVFPFSWWWFPTTTHGHALLLFLLLKHGLKSCWYLGGFFACKSSDFSSASQPDNS